MILLSTTPARMVRPVRYLGTAADRQEYIEYIGPQEQVTSPFLLVLCWAVLCYAVFCSAGLCFVVLGCTV